MQANLPLHSLIEQEQQRFDRQRRITYVTAALLGILMVIVDLTHLLLNQNLHAPVRLLYVLNDLFLILLALVVVWKLIERRTPLITVERTVFVVFTLESLLFNGLIPPLLGQSLAETWIETINDDIWFLLTICTLGFHLFRQRSAVWIVVSLYALSTAIVAAQTLFAARQGVDIAPGVRSLQTYGMGALFLCFIYIVARYRAQAQRLQIEYQLMEEWAFIDGLTGLFNRRRCEQFLYEAIQRSQRYNEVFTICLWDLDHFKQVNDLCGHEYGDEVLRQMSKVAQANIRSSDLLGRWGGEEFFLLLPRTPSAEAAVLVERLVEVLMANNCSAFEPVSASFGLAEFRPGDDRLSLLERADRAMYAAKALGGGQVCVAE